MRIGVFIALFGAIGVLATGASAQVTERVRVSAAGGSLTRTLPRGVVLSIVSPPDFRRDSFSGTQGRWLGPRYVATGDGSLGGQTSIAWSLRFVQAKDRAAAAGTVLTHGWPVDIKGGVSIDHVIGSTTVGTILGHYILTRPAGTAAAAYEAALAFPVAPGLFALLRFELPDPASEDAGAAGMYVVDGVRASLWNRGQAFWALTRPELHGALPPTRVTARVAGGTVRGLVADAFRHPVVGARIMLQRSAGGWRTLAKGRTDETGRYVLRGATARGRYRVVAKVGTSAAWSAPFFP